MRFQVYPSDLTLEEWRVICAVLPAQKLGRPRHLSLRCILNAIFYLHHAGCPWRYLPKTYPKWQSVYYYFAKWSKEGAWEKICHALHGQFRILSRRSPFPHLGIMDAQSVRAAKGEERAYDGFKKVIGRKRNILVDALGIIIGCKVHAANRQENITGKKILDQLPEPFEKNLEKIIADKGYRKALAEYAYHYHHKIEVEVIDRKRSGTNMKPMRWIVERTFAWLNHYRRMSRDYAQKVRNSESMLYISMLPILLHRIAA